jgi:hypothetical protein
MINHFYTNPILGKQCFFLLLFGKGGEKMIFKPRFLKFAALLPIFSLLLVFGAGSLTSQKAVAATQADVDAITKRVESAATRAETAAKNAEMSAQIAEVAANKAEASAERAEKAAVKAETMVEKAEVGFKKKMKK